MHGLGNDFVVVEQKDVSGADLADFSKKVCTRRLGAGADGVIVVCPSEKADVRMRIFNANGTEAEMCGNGIRCFAKYVYENGIVDKENFTVETLAGIMKPGMDIRGGSVFSVRVDMGKALFSGESLPRPDDVGDIKDFNLDIGDRTVNICAVLVGVPHAVVFVPEIKEEDVLSLGPAIEKHSVFPCGTNVDFVKAADKSTLYIKTWERGAGLTLACGTGSCAAAVAANIRGITGKKVTVRHKAGDLEIELTDDKVYMSGPAEAVYAGELFYGGIR